jgi:uncharacterized membrane protein
MDRKFVYAALIAVLCVTFTTTQATAQAKGCSYSDINIKGLVSAINDNGAMVGTATDRPAAFVLSNGKMSFFTFPGTHSAIPANISNTGQIVGSYVVPTDTENLHGFSVLHGVFHKINFPGADTTIVGGNNTQGDIVGSFSGRTVGNNGFLLRSGKFHVIHVPGSSSTSAAAINRFGQIAGNYTDAQGAEHGFVLNPSGTLHFVNFPGGINTTVEKINDAGVIIGGYGIEGQNADHSYMLVKGKYINIDDPNGLTATFALGLNNRHTFAGEYISNDGTRQPSFIAHCPTVF